MSSRNPLTMVLVGLVRAYQLVVSPWFGPRCKYYPSCSAYAITALRVHGPVRGLGLAVWRVLRCNPWSDGGVDHVPPRAGKDEGARTLGVESSGARAGAPQDS
ncbi:membrane protein insertion efficiency factor YidD [Georgenia faecalis]|uniref:Putative membrane protein insertion efficiency factor n=1 Tax=Georgenia faecalis TaxID=2483799 RepID=A0ABV9D966_9MICO|nr:membrane protein insertion efficiency factor YidD [Georgenia faecalis]